MTEEPEDAIRRVFARRARVLRIALGVGALAATLRLATKADWWPPEIAWLGELWMWVALPIFGIMIWSYRCPACGGGIKFDGKTCSSCKRVLA